MAFNKKERGGAAAAVEQLPLSHLAIIMDGNGRWAQKRGLPRTAGHAAGAETFRRVAYHCRDLGMDYLTVYAFSTENWKRPLEEVRAIMRLLKKYLYESIEKMEREQMKLHFFGDLSALPDEFREIVEHANRIAEGLDCFQANICVNYGGRDEIVRAAAAFAREVQQGLRRPEELTEELFSGYLYSAGVPDPELVIRPSGELRVSNFLLWQSAYTEYYFTDTLWPDFSPEEIDRALEDFRHRSRRFGGVDPK